jgi:hypothetical protein
VPPLRLDSGGNGVYKELRDCVPGGGGAIMVKFDKDLIKAINSGKSVLLVGAGASCDEGYPTWQQLFEKVEDYVRKHDLIDEDGLRSITHSDLLKDFQTIANFLTKKKLVEIIENIFNSISPKNGNVYNCISKWPIPVYLTTNYDSVLMSKLKDMRLPFLEKGNSDDEMRSIRMGIENTIFKIHGDFRNPETMIVTKKDYMNIRNDDKYKILREKIVALLHMYDFIIVGYSARDPDFIDQLKRAKEISGPNHPVFMFAPDIEQKDIEKYYFDYNIRIIRYDNHDGQHTGLHNVLNRYSAFIHKRGDSLINKESVDPQEAELASSIYFYNELVIGNVNLVEKALYNAILNIINSNSSGCTFDTIYSELKTRRIFQDEVSIQQSCISLENDNYTECNNGIYRLTPKGKELLLSSYACNKDAKEKFLQYCRVFLERKSLDDLSINKILKQIEIGVIAAFKTRGIEIAKKVFENVDMSLKTSSDVIEIIEQYGRDFSGTLFDAFTDLLLDILQFPSKEVREYFALLCNGYFMYHILGHDQAARLKRLELLQEREILIDSSILIPLIAKDCMNYKFAKELLDDLLINKVKPVVTTRLLNEVIEHADWAMRHYKNSKVTDIGFIATATGQMNRQNLFVDGARNWLTGKSMIAFNDYIIYCLGSNAENQLAQSIKDVIISYKINIIDMEQLAGFDRLQHYATFQENLQKILDERKKRGTYRNEYQCETEAELVVFSKIRSFNFLTHTSNLKYISSRDEILHWSPEILFRFLKLNSCSANLDDLYTCMMGDFYNSGINIVNRELLQAFMSPLFSQARMAMKQQEASISEKIDEMFSDETINKHIDDFTLPFYSIQTATYLARKAEEEKIKISLQMEKLQAIKMLSEKERADYESIKAKQAAKRKRNENKRKNKRRKKKKK